MSDEATARTQFVVRLPKHVAKIIDHYGIELDMTRAQTIEAILNSAIYQRPLRVPFNPAWGKL